MFERTRESAPGAEYVIMMSAENSLLLPRHATHIRRFTDAGFGTYRGHAYRDCLVEGFIDMNPDEVVLTPLRDGGSVAISVPTLIGLLTTDDMKRGD